MFNKIHHVAYTVNDLGHYEKLFGGTLMTESETTREMPDAGYKATVFVEEMNDQE
jgi:hypothetical protein